MYVHFLITVLATDDKVAARLLNYGFGTRIDFCNSTLDYDNIFTVVDELEDATSSVSVLSGSGTMLTA
jgi:glucose-6-phosphate isomerase